jgi:biotin synthase
VVDRYYVGSHPSKGVAAPGGGATTTADPLVQQDRRRLPNDVRERNALYGSEVERTMGGVTAQVRNDWTRSEIAAIYHLPFYELMYRASTVHRMYWNPAEVQQCTLLSIKTGGCTEDCSYCSQSTRHKTFVKPTPTMKVQEVLEAAARAKEAGSTRFCMGAAWRELGNKQNAFNHILEMVRGVNGMGLEVCCTLGMLNADQARQLKEAGLTAYNHNLDTSPEHYPNVISTRTYEDRLNTIANVRDAGISVCCGGILGLGEQDADRVGLLHVLATLPEHPESVPINALVAVEGTPLGNDDDLRRVDAFDMARMIATARIVMPRTMVRLSAGRLSFSDAEQFLMFQAGANSIFNGDKLLTTPNPEFDEDQALFERFGFRGKPAHQGPLVSPAEEQGMVVVTKVQPNEHHQQQQFA